MEKLEVRYRLADALEAMLQKKPFLKISVADITNTSGLSRQTFYRYFADIYDLANWLFMMRNKLSVDVFEENQNIEQSFWLSLKSMQRNKNFYTHFAETDGPNSFAAQYRSMIIDACMKQIGQHNLTDEVMFSINLYAFGSSQMILSWIKSNMPQSPEEISGYLAKSFPGNLLKFYPPQ